MRNAVSFLAAGFSLLVASHIAAQGTQPVCAIRGLKLGRLIRVRDTTPASVVGPFQRCDDTVLTLGYYPGQADSGYTVNTHLIRRIWGRGTQSRTGLIAGTAVGALAGGGIAATRSKICFTGSPPVYARCHDNIALNAALFGALGGVVGLMLGHGFPRWAKIFP